jgi:hypothetical protein
MIYGVPQNTLTFGASTNGKYYWNTTESIANGWVNVSGSSWTSNDSSSGTLIANTPWTGMTVLGEGYGILAAEGAFMWVPGGLSWDTYIMVGIKK